MYLNHFEQEEQHWWTSILWEVVVGGGGICRQLSSCLWMGCLAACLC